MIQNSFPLSVRIADFNMVARSPNFLNKLRSLTLYEESGMNYELDHLTQSAKIRPVKCKVITAHHSREMVGWALCSQEASNFPFTFTNGYDPSQGVLFQAFVNPLFRRKGIGSMLIKTAKRRFSDMKLCFCPWDSASLCFFGKFNHYPHKDL